MSPSGGGLHKSLPRGHETPPWKWPFPCAPKFKPCVLPIWVSSWARGCHRKSWLPPSAALRRSLPLARVRGPPGAALVPCSGSDPIRSGGRRQRRRRGAHRTGLREGGASRVGEAGGQGREGVRVSSPRPPGVGDRQVQAARLVLRGTLIS